MSTPLEECLTFSGLEASSITGRIPDTHWTATRPSASGIQCLAVPSSAVGLVFRIVPISGNPTSTRLQALRSKQDGYEELSHVDIEYVVGVVAIACSHDGRLVCVACTDGSLRAYSATNERLQERWTLPNAHSHRVATGKLTDSPNPSRSTAASASGPIRSLEFQPASYNLLFVDSGKQTLSFVRADATATPSVTTVDSYSITCASWNQCASHKSDSQDPILAVGTADGTIHLLNYNSGGGESPVTSFQKLEFPEGDDADEEEESRVPWTCTHLQWLYATCLVAGYCRVTPSDGADDDDEDVDDEADHEAKISLLELNPDTYAVENLSPLGDIVPFFSVPKAGRHVFYATTISTSDPTTPLLVVASNVSSDTALILYQDSEWLIVDLPEGNQPAAPTDEDDEFTYPVGIATIRTKGGPRLLLASTDGSLGSWTLQNTCDSNFFPKPAEESTVLPSSTLAPTDESTSNEAETGRRDGAAVSFGKGSVPPSFGSPSGFSFAPISVQQSADDKSTPSKSVATSTFSFSSPPGKPVFGQTSLLGAGAGVSGPEEKQVSASPFSNIPVFGSGTSPGVFGKGTSPFSGGFSALAKSEGSAFGTASSGSTLSASAAPFNIFANREGFGSKSANAMAKPLFGESAISKETGVEGKPETSTNEKRPTAVIPSTVEGKAAARAFDIHDKKGTGALSTEKLEDLLEQLGEGFASDELEVQCAQIDPKGSGRIKRDAFIDWYIKLSHARAASTGDDASLDDDEKAEWAEEETKVEELFLKLGSGAEIPVEEFPALIEGLGTTYCEEGEHSRARRKLDSKGKISRRAFLVWYKKWYFGGDDDEDEPVETNTSAQQESAEKQHLDSKGAFENLSSEGKRAARVFDEIDRGNKSFLPIECFEELTDKLGEGFATDEFQKQVALVDPDSSGKIKKLAFIEWYTKLATVDEDGSLDEDDKEEWKEQEKMVHMLFKKLGNGAKIPSSKFPDLFEGLGTTYCDDGEHARAKKRLECDDYISSTEFLVWYKKWLFGGDDNDDSDSDEELPANNALDGTRPVSNWGDTFSKEQGSWKCEICCVWNKPDATTKCAACETPKPGASLPQRIGSAQPAGSKVGSLGLSFGTDKPKATTSGLATEHANNSVGGTRPVSTWGNTFSREPGSWKCEVCSVLNQADATTKCAACETPKPGASSLQSSGTAGTSAGSKIGSSGFSFGKEEVNATTSGSSASGFQFTSTGGGFSFGKASVGPQGQSGFTFNATASQNSGSGFPSAGKGFSFGEDNADKGFTFGGTPFVAKPQASPSAKGFSFGATTVPTEKPQHDSAGKGFSFGTSVSTESKQEKIAGKGFSFAGTDKPPQGVNTGKGFSFGAPSSDSEAKTSNFTFAPVGPVKFGAETDIFGKTIKTSNASASIAPQALKVSGNNSSANSNSYPPLSTKAPSKFGEPTSSEPSDAKTASSAYPPMSATAPSKFGASASSASKTVSSSYPPMSTAAPSKFGASASSASKTASSSYPPMSSSAPSKFGASASSASKAVSSSYPPMSSSAPSKFGASASSAPKTASSAYPPMSSSAPSKFGASVQSAPKTASSSYPPMSASAPSKFGVPSASTATKSHASFSSSTPSQLGVFSTSTQKTKVFSLAPNEEVAPNKLSAIASTHGRQDSLPHGIQSQPDQSTVSAKGESSSTSSHHDSRKMTGGKSTTKDSSSHLSRFSRGYIKISKVMEESLGYVHALSARSDPEARRMIEQITLTIREQFGDLTDAKEVNAVSKHQYLSALQLREEALAKMHSAKQGTEDSGLARERSVAYSQPLDMESERLQRALAWKALVFVHKCDLLELRSRILADLVDGEEMILSESILDVHDSICRLEINLSKLKASTTKLDTKTTLGMRSASFVADRKPLTNGNSKTRSWSEVHHGNFDRIVPPSRRKFRLSHRVGRKGQLTLTSMAPSQQESSRTPVREKMIGKSIVQNSAARRDVRVPDLFSPPQAVSTRLAWDQSSKMDQHKSRKLQFSAPADLKEATLSSLSDQVLKSYGTTAAMLHGTSAIPPQTEVLSKSNAATDLDGNDDYSSLRSKSSPEKLSKRTQRSAPGKAVLKDPSGTRPQHAQLLSSSDRMPSSNTVEPITVSSKRPSSSSSSDTLKSTAKITNPSAIPGKSPFPRSDQPSGNTSVATSGGLVPSKNHPDDSLREDSEQREGMLPDYHTLLTNFYKEHNPTKLADVTRTLEKYQGREAEMFAKLAQKYGVRSPLEELKNLSLKTDSKNSEKIFSKPKAGQTFGFPDQTSKPPLAPSPFSPAPSNPSPFSAPKSSFGGGSAQSTTSGSGTSFGFSNQSQAPNLSAQSPFSAALTPQALPAAPPPSPFSGKSPREVLFAFYQQYNPSKLAEVDKVLNKYKGNEEQLFRNLAKKYNLDPSLFGLPAVPNNSFGPSMNANPGGFGQPSVLGGGLSMAPSPSPFGSPQPATGGFGKFAAASSGPQPVFGSPTAGFGTGAPSFGTLAQSSPNSGFGSIGSNTSFGMPNPFGAPRR